MAGMAWCYASDPNKIHRLTSNDRRFRNDGTVLPVASDPATAGCIWHMVRQGLSDKYTGYMLSVSASWRERKYVCTMYGPEGQPVLECYGASDGECALRALSWIWFE